MDTPARGSGHSRPEVHAKTGVRFVPRDRLSVHPGRASAIRAEDNGHYPQHPRLEVNHQRARTLGLRLRRAQRPAGHVHTLIEAGRLDVALDLSGVTFADSTVVGEIASTHIALHRRGGRLTLLNPSKRRSLLLSISRLASVLEIRPTA